MLAILDLSSNRVRLADKRIDEDGQLIGASLSSELSLRALRTVEDKLIIRIEVRTPTVVVTR